MAAENMMMPQTSPEVMRAKQRFEIVGNAPALNAAVSRAVRVAPIDLSVLITGESGTGKEFFPQIIHAYSARKHAKYIAVNCGAIPEGTIDSELFGHEKGAFTGAVATRKGYFEEADGGTIFLDEVAELPLTTQARLLRVLESGEFMKVGSSTVQRTNIRVVAATNVDLQQAIAAGKFREDLFYRLSTVQIHIPPLRERGTDILLLTRRFASGFVEKYHTPEINLDQQARQTLLRYRWPGNVRQLKNVVEQVALFEAGKEVTEQTLAQYLPTGSEAFTPARPDSGHTYERERDMLFHMIFNLRARIDQLTERLEDHNRESDTMDLQQNVEVSECDSPENTRDIPVLHPLRAAARENQHTEKHEEILDGVFHPIDSHDDEDAERRFILSVLERNDGNRKATATELGISERTLYRKIRRLKID